MESLRKFITENKEDIFRDCRAECGGSGEFDGWETHPIGELLEKMDAEKEVEELEGELEDEDPSKLKFWGGDTTVFLPDVENDGDVVAEEEEEIPWFLTEDDIFDEETGETGKADTRTIKYLEKHRHDSSKSNAEQSLSFKKFKKTSFGLFGGGCLFLRGFFLFLLPRGNLFLFLVFFGFLLFPPVENFLVVLVCQLVNLGLGFRVPLLQLLSDFLGGFRSLQSQFLVLYLLVHRPAHGPFEAILADLLELLVGVLQVDYDLVVVENVSGYLHIISRSCGHSSPALSNSPSAHQSTCGIAIFGNTGI